jgi:hypothetical protein
MDLHCREPIFSKRSLLNSTRIDSTSTWTGVWWAGKSSIRLSSKFVSEVLLSLSQIELVDHVKLAPSALLELADQKRV